MHKRFPFLRCDHPSKRKIWVFFLIKVDNRILFLENKIYRKHVQQNIFLCCLVTIHMILGWVTIERCILVKGLSLKALMWVMRYTNISCPQIKVAHRYGQIMIPQSRPKGESWLVLSCMSRLKCEELMGSKLWTWG